MSIKRLLPVLLILAPVVHAAERNVIFYIADDLGHYMGCYGYSKVHTPHLDSLAADGTLFTRAYATTASCSASRSVIMTGLHNHANGQYGHAHDYHKFSSWPNCVTLSLPRVMSRAGYRTALSGKYHVAPEKVFHYDKYLAADGRDTFKLVDSCKPIIEEKSNKPFFLYIATADPHRGGGRDPKSNLEFKPDVFGNRKDGSNIGEISEIKYKPEDVFVPPFLPDTPACREELAHYYRSVSRVDQGLARLVQILKDAGVYDKTLIVVTSDHGMAFPGGKTTVYEPGLRVPFIVRNPYNTKRGVKCDALISHVDITPSLLDFAGGLDHSTNGPKDPLDAEAFWDAEKLDKKDNRGSKHLTRYHGKSWLSCLEKESDPSRQAIHGSHTFHEIQMYYPMRCIRDERYKLIWNIANPLPFPFASDLWTSSAWQAQLKLGKDANYGVRTVGEYIQRPRFELYDMQYDTEERKNLAADPAHAETLKLYQEKMKQFQQELGDPWIQKWEYE
jgi:N-sulfoglucosamine sulfohydrolase